MTNRPATEKQKNYAKCIAGILGLKLPNEDSTAAYSAFISANMDAYEDARHDWPSDYDWDDCVYMPNYS